MATRSLLSADSQARTMNIDFAVEAASLPAASSRAQVAPELALSEVEGMALLRIDGY